MTRKLRCICAVLVALTAFSACDDGSDLRGPPPPPTAIPPQIGYAPDGGPACDLSKPAGSCRWESDRPMSHWEMLGHARRQSVEVEKVSSAIVLAGMRSSPEQQGGEVAVYRYQWGVNEPFWPNGNAPNNTLILNHNWNWATLAASSATWPSGAAMAGNIKQASFWVPSGKCVGFRPYAGTNLTSPYNFIGNVVCKTQYQGLENWLLWDQNWNVQSMKTGFSNCFAGNCPLPPGF
jgi:hypothetical protein